MLRWFSILLTSSLFFFWSACEKSDPETNAPIENVAASLDFEEYEQYPKEIDDYIEIYYPNLWIVSVEVIPDVIGEEEVTFWVYLCEDMTLCFNANGVFLKEHAGEGDGDG